MGLARRRASLVLHSRKTLPSTALWGISCASSTPTQPKRSDDVDGAARDENREAGLVRLRGVDKRI